MLRQVFESLEKGVDNRCLLIISNNMTRGKLAIKFPDAEGRFVKVRGRSPRTFTNLPEALGNLIANFPTSHVISL